MATVGTKELKNRLSHYLRLVRAGASFLVTDHGTPVAELGPASGSAAGEAARTRAAARGLITLPSQKAFARGSPIRLPGGVKLSDAIREDRR